MSVGRRELALWCGAAIAVMAFSMARQGGPAFQNDSYQYLSTAENIAAGRGPATSLVHFDVERARHQSPAPSTTFPPGYSLAIAAVSSVGLTRERAALDLSMLSFVALFPLLAWGAKILALRPAATRLVLAWLLANSWGMKFSIHILSESAFTALATAAVVTLMAASRPGDRDDLKALLLGHALLGCAYWVRYAGLFLFGAVAVLAVGRVLVRRDRRSLVACAPLGVSAAIIGAGMIRNTLITSSWMGGNTKKVFHPVTGVLAELVRSIAHVFLGFSPLGAGPAEALFALAVVASCALAVWAFQAGRWPASPPACRLLWACLGLYTVGMVYLGIFSVISFGTRMFYPMLPLALLAIGELGGRLGAAAGREGWSRRALAVAAGAATVAYVFCNGRSAVAAPDRTPHEMIEEQLAAPTPEGRPLRAWIDEHVPADAVVIGTEAQATGYALRRRTVSLTEAEYSEEAWDEPRVRALMEAYGAEFVILHPVHIESSFLEALRRREAPPWLVLAAENGRVMVFRKVAR